MKLFIASTISAAFILVPLIEQGWWAQWLGNIDTTLSAFEGASLSPHPQSTAPLPHSEIQTLVLLRKKLLGRTAHAAVAVNSSDPKVKQKFREVLYPVRIREDAKLVVSFDESTSKVSIRARK